ncbi:MAG: nuclear transport factor 2 family protein [Pseudomonadota bacterium]
MKNLLLACSLFLFSLSALADGAAPDAAMRERVGAFIDAWHDDAAHARPAYFDKMASDGVYIGTDKTELWQRDAFKLWAKPYFDRGAAWSFKATRRNIYFSPDRKFIWFDELLDTRMGVCQASGVVRATASGFEIAHYQLSIAVPNEVADKVTASIKQFEAAPAAAK